jgi:Ca-activated chloride channel family protein
MEGSQDIILLSDGDDPVADNEWQAGIEPAREKKIPIHTVGVGTPDLPAFIPSGDDVLRDENNKEVVTTLQEKPLREIARQTRGIYIPAHTNALPLGRLFEDIVASRPIRDAQVEESGPSILYVQRFEWFLAGALLFLTATLLIPDGGFRAPSRFGYRGLRLALLPLALLLVSAAFPERIDELMRQGQDAFDAEDYGDALEFYQQTETATHDPGQVAFNKAACLYRMKKYQEAENHYRRCLEDQQIPGTRQAWSWHALGNCLVKKPPARLDHVEEAIRCYRRCLTHAGADAALRADAAHNLEVAKRLWLKLKAEGKEAPKDPTKDETQPQKKDPGKDVKEKDIAKKELDEGAEQGDQKQNAPGRLYSLPDNDEVLPLPPDATERLLDEAVRRIRRDWRRLAGPSPAGVKDW